jgi:hypothetical protein
MPQIVDSFTMKGHYTMRLIDLQSGQPINIHDRVSTYKGEIGVLVDATPPAHEGETGRVFVNINNTGFAREMEPTVIAAKWVDGTEAV